MIIACLGWGSLVWDPRGLPIEQQWFEDGPFAPVEFSRLSRDGRVTLVLDDRAAPVRLLWAHMTVTNLAAAKSALGDREGVRDRNIETSIGSWQAGNESPALIPALYDWSVARGVDAVIWTALGPRYKKSDGEVANEHPSLEWILEYVGALVGPIRDIAEAYVRRAPPQIDTEYRRHLERAFGWTPL